MTAMNGKKHSLRSVLPLILLTLVAGTVGVAATPKVHEPVIPPAERLGTFKEVEGTIDEESAHYESRRCLNCGTFCYDHDQEVERLHRIEALEEEAS